MKRLSVLLLAVALVGLSGCVKAGTNPPTAPGVQALDILSQVQNDVQTLQNTEVAYFKAGQIDAATNAKFQAAFKQEALDATAVAQAITSASSTATVQQKVDALLADFTTDITNGALGIKDANTKAAVILGISTAEIVVNTIMANYQGK